MFVVALLIALIVLVLLWPRGYEDKDLQDEASFQLWHDAITQQEQEGLRLPGRRYQDELDLATFEDEFITEGYSDYALQCKRAGYKPVGAVHWARLTPAEKQYEVGFLAYKQNQ